MPSFEPISQSESTTITASSGNSFFGPAIQRQEANPLESSSGVEKSCEAAFMDPKDLTWAAAKHFLETEMPSMLTPTPVSFDCFSEKGLKGCKITLKNNQTILVWFNDKYVHVQRPNAPGEAKMGFCNYYYSCDETGKISFTEKDCVRTWNSKDE